MSGGYSKTVSYTYDVDGNRASTQYPEPAYLFLYGYNGRNQLNSVAAWATYNYDESGYTGDLTSRVLSNGIQSTYLYDQLDRATWVVHYLNNSTRGFAYGYQDNTDNVKYILRTGALGNAGDVFNYDLADQANAVQLNVQTPSTTPTPAPNIIYDSNGNRTSFHPYGTSETYGAANSLNQYTTRTINGIQTTAGYDHRGNLSSGLDNSSYAYDAQNRLISATNGMANVTFAYDGLNRQISRTVTSVGPSTTTYSVWDGWSVVEEYQAANSGATTAAYVYGAGGLICGVTNAQFNYYFQDASGSTSNVSDVNGNLLEWYRYDLQGAPFFYDQNDNPLPASALGVCNLFTGQQWRSELGLYDLRNRFYSPNIGRFLQPDPIGHAGGDNLYRYCRNNPLRGWDQFGLEEQNLKAEEGSDCEDFESSEPDFEQTDQSDYGGSDFGSGSDNPALAGLNEFLGIPFENIPIPLPPSLPGIPTLQNPSTGGLSNTGGSSSGGEVVSSGGSGFGGGVGGGLGSSGGGDVRLGDVLDYGPNNLIRQMARYNNQYPAQARSMAQFSNVMAYGVSYPAAVAVAAPVAGYFGLAGWNAYLTNPTFWIGAAGTSIPGLLGYDNPLEVPQSKGEWVGQGIVWIWDGTQWVANRPAGNSPGGP